MSRYLLASGQRIALRCLAKNLSPSIVARSGALRLHPLRNVISGQSKFAFHSTGHLCGSVIPFNLSDIGEGISEVVIKEWFINVGDRVAQFDNICEVQSDKASVTITSRYDGIVRKIHYKVDEMAKVGTALVDIEIEGSEPTVAEKQQEVIDDSQTQDEQSDKYENEYQTGGRSKILTTPAVRRLAAEHNINLNHIAGTGRDGRVLKEDILNHINSAGQQQRQQEAAESPTPVTKVAAASSPAVSGSMSTQKPPAKATPADRVEAIKGITKSMFKTMTASLSVPHFGLSEEINLTQLVGMRPEIKRISSERNVPISYMPFFIKAASLALNEFPILNSSIDKTGENLVFKGSHNIGLAMDTKQGLLVPNIKGVNQKTVLEIAHEMNRLHELGKRGQLGPDDLSGGTFTLSNIGSIGGIFGIPVLMPNEVAIGAIGRLRQVPRFVDDTSDRIERAHVMQVLWSADHRIIDGATMTRFCALWKKYLENPLELLLH